MTYKTRFFLCSLFIVHCSFLQAQSLPSAAALPLLEDGADLAGRSKLTRDYGDAVNRQVLGAARYNPVPITPSPGDEPFFPDEPPSRGTTKGIRYALTGQVYPYVGEDDHLQLWLWDVETPSLVYTDEMVFNDALGEEEEFLLEAMVSWIFSHIPKDPEPVAAGPAAVIVADAAEPVAEPEPAARAAPAAAPSAPGPVETSGLAEGIYLDLAAQYLIMPGGAGGIFYNVSSFLPGGRLGAGLLLRLGPGSLGLGLELGYNHVTSGPAEGGREVNLSPVLLKGDYRLPLNRHGLGIRFGGAVGILLDIDPETTKYLDPILGGRVYLEWAFIPQLTVYGGVGADFLPEADGPILMPGVELGLRWMPFAKRR